MEYIVRELTQCIIFLYTDNQKDTAGNSSIEKTRSWVRGSNTIPMTRAAHAIISVGGFPLTAYKSLIRLFAE